MGSSQVLIGHLLSCGSTNLKVLQEFKGVDQVLGEFTAGRSRISIEDAKQQDQCGAKVFTELAQLLFTPLATLNLLLIPQLLSVDHSLSWA